MSRASPAVPRLLIPCAGPRPDPLNQKQMSPTEGPSRPITSATEITVVTGDRYRVEKDVKDVERMIVDAARGSIMQLAWLVEAETGADFAVNPEYVVTLRAIGS